MNTLLKEHTEPKQYPNCFGCGADNPIGLRLQYRREGDAVVTEFTPGDEHEGWPDIVHGGIITTLLYEVMENFAYQNGTIAMMRRHAARISADPRRSASASPPQRALKRAPTEKCP